MHAIYACHTEKEIENKVNHYINNDTIEKSNKKLTIPYITDISQEGEAYTYKENYITAYLHIDTDTYNYNYEQMLLHTIDYEPTKILIQINKKITNYEMNFAITSTDDFIFFADQYYAPVEYIKKEHLHSYINKQISTHNSTICIHAKKNIFIFKKYIDECWHYNVYLHLNSKFMVLENLFTLCWIEQYYIDKKNIDDDKKIAQIMKNNLIAEKQRIIKKQIKKCREQQHENKIKENIKKGKYDHIKLNKQDFKKFFDRETYKQMLNKYAIYDGITVGKIRRKHKILCSNFIELSTHIISQII